MRNFTPTEYRQVRDEPTELARFAQDIAASKDTEAGRNLDTLVVETLASFVLDGRWAELEAFDTSLLHSIRAFERAAEAGWAEGRQIAAGWETLLRFGEACLAMARDEKALEFARSSGTYEDVLHLLAEREPIASGDIAEALDKSVQRISNVLGDMEEHGLVSRHCVGRRTLVWLGPAGHYYFQNEAGSQPLSAAPTERFAKLRDEGAKLGVAPGNPIVDFKCLQLDYAKLTVVSVVERRA